MRGTGAFVVCCLLCARAPGTSRLLRVCLFMHVGEAPVLVPCSLILPPAPVHMQLAQEVPLYGSPWSSPSPPPSPALGAPDLPGSEQPYAVSLVGGSSWKRQCLTGAGAGPTAETPTPMVGVPEQPDTSRVGM